MAVLTPSKFIPEGKTEGRTIIFYNDPSVPKNVVAFFYLHFTIHNRIAFKVKLNKEAQRRKEILSGYDRQSLLAALNRIASRYDFNWENFLREANRPGGLRIF